MAPGRNSERTTRMMNMMISSGMKMTEAAAMPLCTPSAITTITASQTTIIEISTGGTKSKLTVASAPPSAWVYSPKKAPASSPQRWSMEKIV